jgi:hypothetical protein
LVCLGESRDWAAWKSRLIPNLAGGARALEKWAWLTAPDSECPSGVKQNWAMSQVEPLTSCGLDF